MRPRTARMVVLGLQAALVGALGVLLARPGILPLGIPGEWEWERVKLPSDAPGLALGVLAVIGYAGFVAIGLRALGPDPGRGRQAGWLAGLGAAAITVQVLVMSVAATGYGLTKWVTLGLSGSSGYFATSDREIRDDPWAFWAAYPEWITRQDSLHIGTHPPGLLLASWTLRRTFEVHPGWARAVDRTLPAAVRAGFREILGPQPPAERAAMAAAGMLTLLSCAGTVVPLYALARSVLSARGAWIAAALWPLAPAVVLFHPTADTAYPLLAATALALAARSVAGPIGWAVLAGVVLGVGMQFSLVLLPVGLIVALLLGFTPGFARRSRLVRFLAVGAGFLTVTLGVWALSRANPFLIWSWNAHHHARFYDEYPRSRLGWTLVNPLEVAIALGLPTAVWMGVGLAKRGPVVAWATLAVLAFLTVSGRNLGEVARLWLAFFPALLVAAGSGLERLAAGPRTLAATVTLVGLQLLILQATIQVVYPV